jgi:ERCC4-type nuclease
MRGRGAERVPEIVRKIKGTRMIIIIDSRESTPLKFPPHVKTESAGLISADYSVKGLEHLIGIERKTLSDLCGSLTSGRERFFRELTRLRGYQFKRLLVIGKRSDIEQGAYRSKVAPKSILASLNAIEARFDCPVVFADEAEGAKLVERWCYYFAREIAKNAELSRDNMR